jgi:hypothetical protein
LGTKFKCGVSRLRTPPGGHRCQPQRQGGRTYRTSDTRGATWPGKPTPESRRRPQANPHCDGQQRRRDRRRTVREP